MTKRGASEPPPKRAELERQLSADIRAITARSDRVGRHYARINDVSNSDFHALLHIMVAETAGAPLTLAQLRQRMDVSPPAITYLVDRMIEAGHIRREPDPEDRRKWLLRYETRGMTLAHTFFSPLGAHIREALAHMPDKDLVAAHRVFMAMIDAMSTFEDELAAPQQPEESAEIGRGASTARRRQGARSDAPRR
ncbi:MULTISPECIES: MarR family winged helix-turn-helix transcriptional regulator [Mycobacterium]|uniref:MarR family transcriptional regulator n=1 Tax=Mycobacterium gordonae TaxID=1778 RepID=A0A1A6BE97_MYCGO|nr:MULTISPECIES: MarR family winged helix-turn-helix transcriptional regulator [Mycobacterium]MBI2700784.1 winged helix-turn-helix transcriptional regulator [Mycobacterium sp.]MBX9979466.1 MarR family winged helix-turn-helix transcriptional regulator [Mycobacterium gordonae]MCQ4361327.1 MarR family winged helix-turn-helix transcriptional regulator [Mycobacterium gordonae]MCV7005301.1 winged helix-turn-helix transcriptional regulator [Mycobacterium gordonae]OBS00645.1 MarR family transcriptiona